MDIFSQAITETIPKPFGLYHLSWIVLTAILSAFLCLTLAKKHDGKTDDKVIFTIGIILLLAEVYKEIFYARLYGYYDWFFFPLQLCSMPIYSAIISPLLKNGKAKDTVNKFTALVGGTAGVGVMLFPGSCLNNKYIAMLVHTMLWHSLMIVLSVYITASKGYSKSIKRLKSELLPSIAVFMALALAVSAIDILAYKFYFGTPLNVHGDRFPMMYISPYYGAPFEFITSLKNSLPYPVYLVGYLGVVSVGISLFWLICYGINKFTDKIKRRSA